MKVVPNIEMDSLTETVEPAAVTGAIIEPPVCFSLPVTDHGVDQDLAGDLAVAEAIQKSLLPKEFPTLPGFGLAAFCQSARHIGGDFYDVVRTGPSSALLVVADVMGKGVSAALFAASLRILLRSFAEVYARPGELLEHINRRMFEELSSVDMFITAQVALIDTERRLVEVASAGHCPLLLASATKGVQAIAPNGLPFGIDPYTHYVERTEVLGPDACALLYTDGVTEACDQVGSAFGHERLMAWLARNSGINQSAALLKKQFLADFRSFRMDTPLRDDLTLLFLAEEGQSERPNGKQNTWTVQE
jgi:serine phosphatase RsbU (regulator of sigma subunit)